jgi:hypothetical protein
VLTNLLLEDRSDMGVRGVCGQGEDRFGQRVGQGNSSDQDRLGVGGKEEDMVSSQVRTLGLAVSGRRVRAIPGRKQL